MQTEHIPAEMRDQLRASLPERAFLRRDRGEGLFITNAPAFAQESISIPGFILEKSGALLRILPDESWIRLVEENAPPDHFSASLLRFRNQAPDRQNLILFARGAKLLDDPAAADPNEASAYDRALRQRAAIALRGGCGGALYACAVLNEIINTLYKGENTP